MTTRLFVVALAATASLAVAACGEDDPASAGDGPDAASRKAMLAYARCMRANGVAMADPQFNGGRVTTRAGGPGKPVNEDTMKQADQACAKYREKVKAPELSDSERAEFKKAALANARCMRDHGIKRFPDPTFDSGGGARIKLDRSLNPEGAKFKRAMEACEDTMPDAPSTTSAGE
jgi:hypothetical protein